MFQDVIDAIGTKADAHTTHAIPPEDAGQICVASTTTDAANWRVRNAHFKNGAGVIVQTASERWIKDQLRRIDTCSLGHGHQFDHFFIRRIRLLVTFSKQRLHPVEPFRRIGRGQQFKKLHHAVNGGWGETALIQLLANTIIANLVPFVKGNREVLELFFDAPGPRKAIQKTAVVQDNFVPRNAQLRKHLVKKRDEVQFAQRAVGTDDVGVALGEFLVAAFAGSITSPHRLHLVPAKRERQVIARHHNKPGEWHRQIIAQRLLGYA